MIKIGLIKEGKVPVDNRVVLTPDQCVWVHRNFTDIRLLVQSSPNRCFADIEYQRAGIEVRENINDCDVLIGIKEVPVTDLLEGKTYLFFSHTKKKQPHNQKLLQTIVQKGITLIDFECLEHEDGQRIIGFGFFAGIVGAHNGIMAYGNRIGAFSLGRVYEQKDFRSVIHTYFGLKLPNIKIAVTGSGRVAHGIVEIMNLLGVIEVEKEEYLAREFSYPVYVQLKGADLYEHTGDGTYNREHFHLYPQEYKCKFEQYYSQTDVLMNGVYWNTGIPPLFRKEVVSKPNFRIQVIADITDDVNGSVPINIGDQTIENPVYGVDKVTLEKTAPYVTTSIDIMAVGNLPNELPRDASRYFGEQLIKYILPELFLSHSTIIERATIVKNGELTSQYLYLHDFVSDSLTSRDNNLSINS